jgi:hypothetical protein
MRIEFNINHRKDVEEAIAALTAVSAVLKYYDWEDEDRQKYPPTEEDEFPELNPVKTCTCAEARAAEETVLAEATKVKAPRKPRKPTHADVAAAADLVVPDQTLSLDDALAGNFEEVTPTEEESPLLLAETTVGEEPTDVELQNRLAECVKTVPGGPLWFKAILNKCEKTKLSSLVRSELIAAISEAEHLISLS